jgi:hypothetical protein
MLPQLAKGDANKVFVIPSEFSQAFGGLGKVLGAASASSEPAVAPASPAASNGPAALPEAAGAAALPPGAPAAGAGHATS